MHGATGAGTNLIVAAFNATFGIKRKSKNEDDECVKDRPALNDDNTEVAAKNNRVCKKYEEDAYISNDERKKNGVKRRRQEGTGNNTVVNITPLPNHDDDDDNDNVTTVRASITTTDVTTTTTTTTTTTSSSIYSERTSSTLIHRGSLLNSNRHSTVNDHHDLNEDDVAATTNKTMTVGRGGVGGRHQEKGGWIDNIDCSYKSSNNNRRNFNRSVSTVPRFIIVNVSYLNEMYLLRIAVEAQKPLDHLKEQLSKRLKGACLGLLTTSKLRIESRIVPNRGGVTFKDRKEQEEEEEWEGEDKSSELKRGEEGKQRKLDEKAAPTGPSGTKFAIKYVDTNESFRRKLKEAAKQRRKLLVLVRHSKSRKSLAALTRTTNDDIPIATANAAAAAATSVSTLSTLKFSISQPAHVSRSAGTLPSSSSSYHQLPSGWTAHYTDDGIPYYYNARSSTSTWESPMKFIMEKGSSKLLLDDEGRNNSKKAADHCNQNQVNDDGIVVDDDDDDDDDDDVASSFYCDIDDDNDGDEEDDKANGKKRCFFKSRDDNKNYFLRMIFRLTHIPVFVATCILFSVHAAVILPMLLWLFWDFTYRRRVLPIRAALFQFVQQNKGREVPLRIPNERYRYNLRLRLQLDRGVVVPDKYGFYVILSRGAAHASYTIIPKRGGTEVELDIRHCTFVDRLLPEFRKIAGGLQEDRSIPGEVWLRLPLDFFHVYGPYASSDATIANAKRVAVLVQTTGSTVAESVISFQSRRKYWERVMIFPVGSDLMDYSPQLEAGIATDVIFENTGIAHYQQDSTKFQWITNRIQRGISIGIPYSDNYIDNNCRRQSCRRPSSYQRASENRKKKDEHFFLPNSALIRQNDVCCSIPGEESYYPSRRGTSSMHSYSDISIIALQRLNEAIADRILRELQLYGYDIIVCSGAWSENIKKILTRKKFLCDAKMQLNRSRLHVERFSS